MRADVQHYYGEVLQSTADLKTSACCTDTGAPAFLREILAEVHDEVLARYYGCGLVLPEALEGVRVLDLGCGAGRDCYVLARLVGAGGHVTGVDMTAEQLAVARRHVDWHAERFGYAEPNTVFVEGDIERLDALDLPAGSFDVIVSNCVINLAADKGAVLDGAWRLLRPGGELYFADIYADRRIPDELRDDPVLYGECLAGALYWNDFLALARRAGFTDPRVVESRPVTVDDPALAERTGDIAFHSVTCRLFRLDDLDPDREDYGQAVRYLGTARAPDALVLDRDNRFPRGDTRAVDGNTWRMLAESRLAPAFEFVVGDGRHRGAFEPRDDGLTQRSTKPAAAARCC